MSIKKKKKCEECGKLINTLYQTKDHKFICRNCNKKRSHIIGSGGKNTKLTLKQALDRTYIVKGYLDTSGNLKAKLSFPQVLAGRKIKLMLVEDLEK